MRSDNLFNDLPAELTLGKIFVEHIGVVNAMYADVVGRRLINDALLQMIKTLKNGGTIFIAGNGGSAGQAQHFSAELVGRFKIDRPAFAGLSLTTDTSILTAWANDVSFDDIFARQLSAFGKKGDVFVGLSTSGNSKNIIKAVQTAKHKKMVPILLLGCNDGILNKSNALKIEVPSRDTARIQEAHILLIHYWCGLIEHTLTNGETSVEQTVEDNSVS